MIDGTTGREVVEYDGKSQPITASLRNAAKIPGYNQDATVLAGEIRGDIRELFSDGDRIFTSFLVKEVVPDVFLTRSGDLYRVESWAK